MSLNEVVQYHAAEARADGYTKYLTHTGTPQPDGTNQMYLFFLKPDVSLRTVRLALRGAEVLQGSTSDMEAPSEVDLALLGIGPELRVWKDM